MSFDKTDLHTLIVRVHHGYKVAIGKVIRITLQAAANGKFPLYKTNGESLKLSSAEIWLLYLAAAAEQQDGVRWWTKGPWSRLRAVLVSEPKFWQWAKDEFGAGEQTKAGVVTPPTVNAVVGLIKEGKQPARTISWDQFCDIVRDRCGAWSDHKNRVPKRGFSDKTIKRIVRRLGDK